MRRFGVRLGLGLAAGLGFALPGEAAAMPIAVQDAVRTDQVEVSPPVPARIRGWLGIQTALDREAGTTAPVRVEQLYRGGPAHAAGLRVGDVVVEVNGIEATADRFVAAVEGLLPGAPISFRVRRGDSELTIAVEAGSRPEDSLLFPRVVENQIDSARAVFETRVRRMDSAANVQTEGVFFSTPRDSTMTVRLESLPETRNVIVRIDSAATRWRLEAPEIAGSWSFSVTGPELEGTPLAALIQSDSLHGMKLRSQRIQLERQLRALNSELSRARARGAVQADEVQRIEELQRRLRDTRRMEEFARTGVEVRVIGDALAIRGGDDSVVVRRPLAPYLTGLNRIAGAELRPLNAQLASYFEVENGLLVVDVTRGSPAAEAGLLSGDVIVAVDDEAVESVDGLRRRISATRDGWTLTVSRRGRTLELELR